MQKQEALLAEKNKTKLHVKVKNISFTVVLLMLSLGQWNDTKEVLVSVYEEVISRFTNEVEYQRLEKLRIGLTEQYTIDLLGSPQAVKPSKLINNLQYSYYNNKKYVLITFIKDQRLSGFTVVSKNSDFLAPVIYIDKQLNTQPIAQYLPTQNTILTNTGSLEYFAEGYDLSRRFMFYKLLLGHVNYSANSTPYSQTINELNEQLSTRESVDLSAVVFSSPLIPNFYSITELSNDVMQESLLSNYEMSALFSVTY